MYNFFNIKKELTDEDIGFIKTIISKAVSLDDIKQFSEISRLLGTSYKGAEDAQDQMVGKLFCLFKEGKLCLGVGENDVAIALNTKNKLKIFKTITVEEVKSE